MKIPLVERRQIENEMIFRRGNEKIGISLDKIDNMYVEDGTPTLVRQNDMTIQFICECSDERCKARISPPLSTYQEIHLNRSSYILKPGHEVSNIENVTQVKSGYGVVKKNHSTAEPSNNLNITPQIVSPVAD